MTDPAEATQQEEREYQVIYSGTATTYVTVTASNASDAVNLADDKISSQLCHQCTHPDGSGFRSSGPVEREWPEYMEVTEVNLDGETVDEDEY